MGNFVHHNSIVRTIWGHSDTILLIFAGASAEFALNKAVDWLYFTGKLPKDPLGRLFSTVAYARAIVFSEQQKAIKAIKGINAAHATVENKRGETIPDWAYRDVLFMLIDYSIRSYDILERKLSYKERQEVFDVFLEVGKHMKINDLPTTYEQFKVMRHTHINANLHYGVLTKDLYKQYRKHLGFVRYKLLIESQILITPKAVNQLLGFRKISFLKPLILLYKLSRRLHLDNLLKNILLPSKYKKQIKSLNHTHTKTSKIYFFTSLL